MSNWLIYQGTGEQHGGIDRLPKSPAWRTFVPVMAGPRPDHRPGQWVASELVRGQAYRADPDILNPVNAALYLRRPLLVTGNPGVGKSTLAYSIAWELGLGPVLRWSISSSSTLRDGLYRYDAIGRLQDASLRDQAIRTDIGRYLRLGPLGTAFLPGDTPRVLLIDEIDKAGLDLPNDLLSIFEEGRYEIDELVRMADTVSNPEIPTADPKGKVPISKGEVSCRQFPMVILTSNGEREFPPAFLRRCVRLSIKAPDEVQLARMIGAQMGADMLAQAGDLIDKYRELGQEGMLASDQLLNAIYLTCRSDLDEDERTDLADLLLQSLVSELG